MDPQMDPKMDIAIRILGGPDPLMVFQGPFKVHIDSFFTYKGKKTSQDLCQSFCLISLAAKMIEG